MIRKLALLLGLSPCLALGDTLSFPNNASLQAETQTALDSYMVPTGVWADGDLPSKTVEGEVTQQAWRIAAQTLTSLQIIRPLRDQLRAAGFDILFECQTIACGGFDFRFATKTLPPPDMQINLGDFRFLSAKRDLEAGVEYISLFASRTANAGFVQVTRVGPSTGNTAPLVQTNAPAMRTANMQTLGNVAAQLDQLGFAVLDDLTFQTGSSNLGDNRFASLQALADYLQAHPDRTIALVGHTDASGSLNANIALSKRRARAVLDRLANDYGVRRQQMEAEGMGYLSPIGNNLTEAGRDANRRVEVIITSTDP